MPKSNKPGKQRAAGAKPAAQPSGSQHPEGRAELRKFFVRLASDLELFCRFVANPEAAAKQAGVTEEDRELLFSGDQGRIYAALRPDLVPQMVQPAAAANEQAASQAACPGATPAGCAAAPGASPWGVVPYGYYWLMYYPMPYAPPPVSGTAQGGKQIG